jgi:TetR/AcrR family transcriptional regulator, transcriptional repressor of bet genes
VSTAPAYKRAEPDARRLSLVEACARVLAREGIAGASVRSIAVEAGVSAGLVGHYFPGVDALIAATYVHTGARVDAALAEAVAAARPGPRTQLEAFVTASFSAPIADPELLSTWIAFWSLVRVRPDIARLHDEQYGGFRAQLEVLLRNCAVPEAELRAAAIAIAALVDGLWLELCLSPQELTPAEAAAIARAALARLIWTGR